MYVVVEIPILFIVGIFLAIAIVFVAVMLAAFAVAVPQMLLGGLSGKFTHRGVAASPISATVSGGFFVYYIVSGMIYGMQSLNYLRAQNWIQNNVFYWADTPTSRQFMPPMGHYLAYIFLGMLLTGAVAFVVTLCVAPFVGEGAPTEPTREAS